MISSIKAVPGVMDAAVSPGLPLEGSSFGMPFTIAGQPDFADPSQRPGAGFDMITPDYFKTYSIPVLRGRAFTDQDNAASVHVAMVNKKFADKFFAGKDPTPAAYQCRGTHPRRNQTRPIHHLADCGRL